MQTPRGGLVQTPRGLVQTPRGGPVQTHVGDSCKPTWGTRTTHVGVSYNPTWGSRTTPRGGLMQTHGGGPIQSPHVETRTTPTWGTRTNPRWGPDTIPPRGSVWLIRATISEIPIQINHQPEPGSSVGPVGGAHEAGELSVYALRGTKSLRSRAEAPSTGTTRWQNLSAAARKREPNEKMMSMARECGMERAARASHCASGARTAGAQGWRGSVIAHRASGARTAGAPGRRGAVIAHQEREPQKLRAGADWRLRHQWRGLAIAPSVARIRSLRMSGGSAIAHPEREPQELRAGAIGGCASGARAARALRRRGAFVAHRAAPLASLRIGGTRSVTSHRRRASSEQVATTGRRAPAHDRPRPRPRRRSTPTATMSPSRAGERPSLALQPPLLGSPSTPASSPPPPELGMPASAPVAVILMLEQWW